MDTASHAVQTALTGHIPFTLLVAAALAYPLSRFLLWLYTRAVLRSMRARTTPRDPVRDRARSTAATVAPPQDASPPPSAGPALQLEEAGSASGIALPAAAAALYRDMVVRPWRVAAVYAVAGGAFAAVMTAAFLLSTHMAFVVTRVAMIWWTSLWPAVLATAAIAATTTRVRLALMGGYGLGFLVIAAIVLPRSPDASLWQLALFWALSNGPPTVLLLAFVTRRVRAVGPLVLLFTIVAVLGSQVLVSAVGATDTGMRAVVRMGVAVGLHATAMLMTIAALGFASFGVLGWLALRAIGRSYQRRGMSDQSLMVAAMWMLFAVTGSIGLVFEGVAWGLTSVVAVAACLLTTHVGFRLLRTRRSAEPGPHLLLLRVFALGRHSERLYDVFATAWRHVGPISLIAGPDLATSTIEPHEFMDLVSGTLSRRFIDGPAALEQRLSEVDRGRDPDGRFRVADFFCHDDSWHLVLQRLVRDSDAVLMDLRGFTRERAGCVFEVHALVSAMRLDRVVFVVDGTTDRPFLEHTVQDAWARDAVGRTGVAVHAKLTLFELADPHRGIGALQRVVCRAACGAPIQQTATI